MPLALDLCCGEGGWAEGLIAAGWDVLGVDLLDYSEVYPGDFVCADLLKWELWRVMPVRLVVASPPCQEFSRWSMPWLRAKNPPHPDLSLVDRSYFIAAQLGVPIILENVRGAQKFLGRSRANSGPFHLWGNVPALVPCSATRRKSSRSSSAVSARSKVDLHLAQWVGKYFLNLATGPDVRTSSPVAAGGYINHPALPFLAASVPAVSQAVCVEKSLSGPEPLSEFLISGTKETQ